MSLYNIEVALENGEKYKLEKYKGKAILIVNTASKCGYTKQFEDLQKLYEKYQDEGLVILGFPSDQFKQEMDTGEEAAAFCRQEYGVSFPMHEIIKVNGKDAHPLFKLLTEEKKGIFGGKIKWNFTKFLVNKNGEIVERYGSKDKPLEFEDDIKKYL